MAGSAEISEAGNGRLHVSGTLNFATVLPLRRKGEQMIARSAQQVEIDFSAVEASGSAAVSLMMCWLRSAARDGRQLHFCGLPPLLKQIISVSGLAGHPAFIAGEETASADL